MMGAVQRQAYEKSRQMYQYIENNCSCTVCFLVMEDAHFRMHGSLLPGFSSMGLTMARIGKQTTVIMTK